MSDLTFTAHLQRIPEYRLGTRLPTEKEHFPLSFAAGHPHRTKFWPTRWEGSAGGKSRLHPWKNAHSPSQLANLKAQKLTIATSTWLLGTFWAFYSFTEIQL